MKLIFNQIKKKIENLVLHDSSFSLFLFLYSCRVEICTATKEAKINSDLKLQKENLSIT